jgi:thioredoxin 1
MMDITGRDFDKEVLDCKLPVFTCFTARWCHSCFPTCFFADELVKEYEGRVKFVKVDIEENSEIAEQYHIIPIPTILLFQDSKLVKKLIGFQELSSLKALLIV